LAEGQSLAAGAIDLPRGRKKGPLPGVKPGGANITVTSADGVTEFTFTLTLA